MVIYNKNILNGHIVGGLTVYCDDEFTTCNYIIAGWNSFLPFKTTVDEIVSQTEGGLTIKLTYLRDEPIDLHGQLP